MNHVFFFLSLEETKEVKIKGIYDDLNTKIVLSQLASEQNDRNELLSNEPIDMISDGLIRYTKDRDKYYYNSNDSKHFVYQTKIYR